MEQKRKLPSEARFLNGKTDESGLCGDSKRKKRSAVTEGFLQKTRGRRFSKNENNAVRSALSGNANGADLEAEAGRFRKQKTAV